jgi:hypothetical protein
MVTIFNFFADPGQERNLASDREFRSSFGIGHLLISVPAQVIQIVPQRVTQRLHFD